MRTLNKAFPSETSDGMSLRDYFAAKSLPVVIKLWDECLEKGEISSINKNLVAEECYEYADAMIKERNNL